jgi:hypothetical protein
VSLGPKETSDCVHKDNGGDDHDTSEPITIGSRGLFIDVNTFIGTDKYNSQYIHWYPKLMNIKGFELTLTDPLYSSVRPRHQRIYVTYIRQ